MTPSSAAVSHAEELLSRLRFRLFTEADFRECFVAVLEYIREAGLAVHTEVMADGHPIADYGWAKEAANTGTYPIEPLLVRISWGPPSGTTAQDHQMARSLWDQMKSLVHAILEEHWRAREPVRAIWSGADDSVGTKLVRTVADAIDHQLSPQCISYVRLDCDGFGAVKEKLGGEEQANEVILRIASFFREALANHALVFHPHGDEFSLVFLGQELRDVIDTLITFQDRFREQDFRPESHDGAVHLGIRMVVAAWPYIGTDVASHKVSEHLRQITETIDIKSPRQRQFILLAGDEPEAERSLKKEAIEEAVLAARCSLSPSQSQLSGNALLQVVVDRLCNESADALGTQLDHLRQKLMLSAYASTDVTRKEDEQPSRYIHTAQVAIVLLHVLLKRAFRGKRPLKANDRVRLVIRKSMQPNVNWDMVVQRRQEEDGWQDCLCWPDVEASSAVEVEAGNVWVPRELSDGGGVVRWVPTDSSGVSNALSPCLVVAVGARAGAILSWVERWSAAVVYVDDRPVTSGHLPDFWQSNLARIVVHCLHNPNIRTIIIATDDSSLIERTSQYLCAKASAQTNGDDANETTWDSEFISKITAATTIKEPALRRFYSRRHTIITAAATRSAILQAGLKAYLQTPTELAARGDAESINLSSSYTEGTLTNVHALQCKDLAEAFPRILEILRHRDTQKYTEPSGRTLSELSAVRIELTRPLDGQIPAYWEPERQELDEYYSRAFAGSESLFGSRFRAWGANGSGLDGVDQYERALTSLSTVITERRVDRRVLLVTPQPPGDSASDPLGLLAVHIMPRLRQNDFWDVDFLWVWRSVEALVGFPFSAYGSVRFAKDMSDELAVRCNIDSPGIRLGTVVYSALSLHLFCDDTDLAIARRIDLEARR